MEALYHQTVPITGLLPVVKTILQERYQLKNSNLTNSLRKLEEYLKPFRNDLTVIVECPYVDKTYRDTYYTYYASKNHPYHRNSIRLSLLDTALSDHDFRTVEGLEKVKSAYLGFIVLRPTFPAIVGT